MQIGEDKIHINYRKREAQIQIDRENAKIAAKLYSVKSSIKTLDL